jgi:hypothetical protein
MLMFPSLRMYLYSIIYIDSMVEEGHFIKKYAS